MTTKAEQEANQLHYAAKTVESASSLVLGLSSSMEDAGNVALCESVAARLYEESEHLRAYADRILEILEENRAKDAGEVPETPQAAPKLFAVIDLRATPVNRRAKVKWYSPNTTFGDTVGQTRRTYKRGICLHHSAVRGGFASHASRRKRYAETPLEYGWLVAPNVKISREEYQHYMALKHRWIGDPPGEYNNGVSYQAISSLSGVLYYNLPFDWVTWASHGANNEFLSMCWDGHSRHDTFDEGTVFRHFETTVNQGLKEGHFRQGLEFTVHEAWTNKPCPGKWLTEFVVDHVAPKLGADVRLDFRGAPKARSIAEILGS
jgi:hypothetical protein